MEGEPTRPAAATQTTKQLLQALIRLQEIDKKRDGDASLIGRSAELLARRAQDVERRRESAKAAEEALIGAKKAAAETELELKSKAANIHKLELQLNTAKTNQEYQALLAQLQRLREEVSREEDAGLAHYERIEQRDKAVAAARAAVKKAEDEHAEFAKACERDVAEAKAEVAGSDDARNGLLGRLTIELRETYEQLRAVREGIAIVPLDGRCCGGCGVIVTPNEISRLGSCSSIITCKSCQRILYSTAAIPYV